MQNPGLENHFRTSDSSSSYFDFVEKKIEDDFPATSSGTSVEDGIVVQVMDQETTEQLKLKYFNGYAFPE